MCRMFLNQGSPLSRDQALGVPSECLLHRLGRSKPFGDDGPQDFPSFLDKEISPLWDLAKAGADICIPPSR